MSFKEATKWVQMYNCECWKGVSSRQVAIMLKPREAKYQTLIFAFIPAFAGAAAGCMV